MYVTEKSLLFSLEEVMPGERVYVRSRMMA